MAVVISVLFLGPGGFGLAEDPLRNLIALNCSDMTKGRWIKCFFLTN